MLKKWQVADKMTLEFKNRFPEINDLVLQLLFNRGLDTQKKIDEFLNPDYTHNLHDPFLFKDMPKAVDRIWQAINNDEKIIVHGDYDADGVTGAAVLIKALKFLGGKNVEIFLPHREKDGYGLNTKNVEQFKKDNCQLIITVDCGISNAKEIALAKTLGIDVIVTDHHQPPPQLPITAIALINPKVIDEHYPFDQLAGVGCAFKLVQALLTKSNIDLKKREAFEKWLLDLVVIGTIADCSPVVNENRTLVKYGLVVLNKTHNIGLQQLLLSIGYDSNKTKFNTYNIGFQIAPRINAAGRIDHANTAFKLLISENEEEAKNIAIDLNNANYDRQKKTSDIFKQAKEQGLSQSADYIIVVNNNDWPLGLVGLVAGKLVQEFNRPTIVIGSKEGEIAGSARSIPQFNLVEALREAAEYLSHFGGHSQAAGFSLINENKLNDFKLKIKEIAKNKLQNLNLEPIVNIEAEINLTDINWEFFTELEKFEPFGEQNHEPLFLIKQVEISEVKLVGQENQHLKLKLKQKDKYLSAIGFCFNEDNDNTNWCQRLKNGDLLDVVTQITANEWNGNRELQLKLVDIKQVSN